MTHLREQTRAVIWQLIADQDATLALQISRWWTEKTGEVL